MSWTVPGLTEVVELGSGAQGRVVLARRGDGSLVAVKYLNPGMRESDLAAFHREAELLALVDDPHVARLLEFVPNGDTAAIVMEAVPGASLRTVLAEGPPLPPEAALTLLKGSLLGLAAAHAAGVVHRDFKPANILVGPDGMSRLVDFGIALLAGEEGQAGTPAYMAPEQWEGGAATPATDVYSATCVFYECLTGRAPYSAETVAVMRRAHLHAPPPLEGLPEPLRVMVARGLAKTPQERPEGALALVAELETTAVAAYGTGWERDGVEMLAASAAALSTALPVAALAAKGVLAKLASAKIALATALTTATTVVVASLLLWPSQPEIRPAWDLLGLVPTSSVYPAAGGFVFYAAAEGGTFEMVSVAARTGRIRWRAPVSASYVRGASPFDPTADDDVLVYYLRALPGPPSRRVEVVAADAVTGRDRWVYGRGGIRIVSEPVWCTDSRLCLTRRDLETGTEDARVLDATTGAEVADTDPVDGRAIGVELYASEDNRQIMRITPKGKEIWRRSVQEVFGTDLALNAGWSVHSDGKTYLLAASGNDAYSENGKRQDLAKRTMAALDFTTGRPLWRSVGTGLDCGTLNGSTKVPVRCALKAFARYEPRRYEVTDVTVEGFDLRTGRSTWTFAPGAVKGFAVEDDSILQIDDTTYLVRTPAGPRLLDALKGPLPLPSPVPSGWCGSTHTLMTALPPADLEKGYFLHHWHPCTASGGRLKVPATTPDFAGTAQDGVYAWADLDGVHAVFTAGSRSS